MDLNKAQIIGRLTRDPETRTTTTGTAVTSFSVATNFVWTDANREKKENVEYHNVVAWRKLAEVISQYLKKGSRVYIEGRLQTRSWDGQDGVKRYRTEIIADNLIMLDSKPSSYSSETPPPPTDEVIQVDNSPVINDLPTTQTPPAERSFKKDSVEEEISVEDIPF